MPCSDLCWVQGVQLCLLFGCVHILFLIVQQACVALLCSAELVRYTTSGYNNNMNSANNKSTMCDIQARWFVFWHNIVRELCGMEVTTWFSFISKPTIDGEWLVRTV